MRLSGRKYSRPEASEMSGWELKQPHTSSMRLSMRAAARCTAPMKALLPPPTIPILSFRFIVLEV